MSRIIYALDVPSLGEAALHVDELGDEVGCYKFGLEFLTSMMVRMICRRKMNYGQTAVGEMQQLFDQVRWNRVMWDGKFDDIPATMAGASKALAEGGPKFFTVHASAGRAAMESAVANECPNSMALAVTVLTLLKHADSMKIFGSAPQGKVIKFARLTQSAGIRGIVCAPAEATFLRKYEEFNNLTFVCPGVRPFWAMTDDQDPARVMTPRKAILGGADYVVIGRPIRKWEDHSYMISGPKSRKHAAQLINAEIETALADRG